MYTFAPIASLYWRNLVSREMFYFPFGLAHVVALIDTAIPSWVDRKKLDWIVEPDPNSSGLYINVKLDF